jgi:hypothetical protein
LPGQEIGGDLHRLIPVPVVAEHRSESRHPQEAKDHLLEVVVGTGLQRAE